MTDMTEDQIQERIAQRLEAARNASTAAEAEAARVAQAEADRVAPLEAAKAHCAAVCGPISEALAKAATDPTDPMEVKALTELEAEVHADHAESLQAAYLTFSGQREGDSHPAQPGVTTPLSSEVSVAAATRA